MNKAAVNSRPGRRWRRVTVLVGLLLVLAGGVWFVFVRGRRKAGLLEQAYAALQVGDRKAAEGYLREVLAANPESAAARGRLLYLYLEDRRYDEAEALAKEWTAIRSQAVSGWKSLAEIAFRRLRLDEAERIARSVADQDPTFAQLTTIRIHDARGSIEDRLMSADSAVNLGTLTKDYLGKADLLIYAGETLLDLSFSAPEVARKPFAALGRRYLREAGTALKQSSATGQVLRDLTDRINLLSESDTEAALASRTLASSLAQSAVPKARTQDADKDTSFLDLLAAISWYHARRGEFEQAVKYAREIAQQGEKGFLRWLRAYHRLETHRCDRGLLLSVLDESPVPDNAEVSLIRAGVLMTGDDAERAKGRDLLSALAGRAKENPAVGIQAYRLLASQGGAPEGLSLLESIAEMRPELGTEALVAGLVAGSAADRERALRQIGPLAGRIASRDEGIKVLSLLRQAGKQPIQTYVDAELPGTGEEAGHHRLSRAIACTTVASLGPNDEVAEFLRTAAVRDLQALRSLALSKQDLDDAWRLASLHSLRPLTGYLVARATTSEGPPETAAFGCLVLAANTEKDAWRAEVANGIREFSAPEAPTGLLLVLAKAVEDRSLGAPALLSELAALDSDQRSRRPALLLSARVAYRQGRQERAEKDLRSLLALRPESVEAREMLSELLLERKAYAEALEVVPALGGSSFYPYNVRALALWNLDRKDEALEMGRAAVRALPGNAEAYLLLAMLHLVANRRDDALAALSVAPLTREVALMRAKLLVLKAEYLVAESLYSAVLANDSSDLEAWKGFLGILGTQGRHEDLITVVTRRLDAKDASPEPPLRGELLVARGQAHEALGQIADALRDYEGGLGVVPRDVRALNNAAWLILQSDPQRLATAREYVRRALEASPGLANVLDTAAHVALESKEYEAALGYAERAIAALPKLSYKILRARILRELGRKGAAREQLQEVVKSAPAGSQEAKEATEALRRDG